MRSAVTRRNFVKGLTGCPLVVAGAAASAAGRVYGQRSLGRVGGPHLKLSLNAYSFNSPLSRGEMTLDELLDFCAELNLEAVDLTAYYFPGYPDPPADEILYRIKRRAFVLGLDISGTGVRNDFTVPDRDRRNADIQLVKKWLECAARLGAPVLRVFAGKGVPSGYGESEVHGWVVECLKECAEYGSRFGVMTVLQNHAELIQSADQLLEIVKRVDSEWLGIHLDIGSFRTEDPYRDIARATPYAVTWQIKEELTVDGRLVPTDLRKVFGIIRDAGYRGYLPLETLGPGDPKTKVRRFLAQVRAALA